MAEIVGAKPEEVILMNTLTVNLHLLMVSFYRPTPQRFKILIEGGAFPSDQYAVASQVAFHGFDPNEAIVELKPRPGEDLLRTADILQKIEEEGDSLALIMMGGVNYYSGQFYSLQSITQKGHEVGAVVGFDLAHAVGNVPLALHDWKVDFAVWCTYKYLNSGPGGIAAAFIHEQYARNRELPRFAGWWGHDKETRFLMGPDFHPIPGAEGWQLSNPPILSLAAIRASLAIFDEVGIAQLREKSKQLTGYFEYLVKELGDDVISVITPSDPEERGCQLSIQVKNANRDLHDKLTGLGVISDWREPDVIRCAPVPLYNSYQDVYHMVQKLKAVISGA